jgi:hypothetical protein
MVVEPAGTARLHKLTQSRSQIGQIRIRLVPEASVSAKSPTFPFERAGVS